MAELITMPKMSDTMTEGVIVKWNAKKGDTVKSGDILAEVETDKATMDMEVYSKGVVLELLAKEGDAVAIDSPIAVIGKEGEDYQDLLSQAGSSPQAEVEDKTPAETSEPKTEVTTAVSTPTPTPVISSHDSRIKASPLAKKIAEEKGISLDSIQGTGENGRIVKRDLENISQGSTSSIPTQSAVLGEESFTEVPVSQMRKTIAARLSESKFNAPHFYLNIEVNMDKAVAARAQMNEISDVKISVNDIVIKAVAASLRKNPKINSSWLGTKIRYNNHIHIGVAMAVDEGLLVPVVRFADQKPLSAISSEVKAYGAKAKDKKLTPEDWTGNTFTISNLGMFGIEDFTAIVNPPDACILAVGTVKDSVGVVNGEIKPVKTMKLTLSCDHRVVDGATGAQFLQTLKQFLEEPVKLLV